LETIWFAALAFLLIVYVILDGFDLGAGIIHLIAARTEAERRSILAAIGPVWDGNEVWLLAAVGTLYFAFPLLYASSFSGFYLPLNIVLWLLMLRAVGLEFRSHIESPLWRSFLDATFSLSSLLLALFFGAALGNVVRGVPLGPDGYFFAPLWTSFKADRHPGILDWYTLLIGALALISLAFHGACYLAVKTEGILNARARRISAACWWPLTLLTVLSLVATLRVHPQVVDNYRTGAAGWFFPVVVAFSLAAMVYFRAKRRDRAAFLASVAYLAAMLGGAAFGLYPTLLPASTDPAFSLTIHNAATGSYGLKVGLVWWPIGMALAIAYFVRVYRTFGGKVSPPELETTSY
jgi:cytochrome d ubiquinol oxidase subunit II